MENKQEHTETHGAQKIGAAHTGLSNKMTDQELRLHLGELTASEIGLVRAVLDNVESGNNAKP